MPRPDTGRPETEDPDIEQREGTDGVTASRDARADGNPPHRSPRFSGAAHMLHGFRPGRLLAGLTALALTLLYAGDASGAWHVPWFVVFPVVVGGLSLAGVAGFVHYGLRRRRRTARAASSESTDAPARTSGNQAIR
ncbi:hypothetical protein ABZ348_05890 [Streptomyces sp. NPDC005963]|uniref:hypothetical protein n=1 Tax=Streptomyces sp. NPDC005963 TaxID=3156721 RepID=UPI0033F1D4E6